MKSFRIVLSFTLILIIKAGFSQIMPPPIKDFLDLSLKTCLDSAENQSTRGQIDCAIRTRGSWEREMNRYYQLLMVKLSGTEKETLQTAQKKWLEYREAEFTSSRTIYNGLEGTMWNIVAVNRQLEIVKQRALDLESYYNDLVAGR